jgi:hypothetical protein
MLAVAAGHLGFVTRSRETMNVSYHYRSEAILGLRGALANFNRQNADAVLAASIVLSWLASTWKEWSTIWHGSGSVWDALEPYKETSYFREFLHEINRFPLKERPCMILHPVEPDPKDLDALDPVQMSLQEVVEFVIGREQEFLGVQRLISFVRDLPAKLPFQRPEDQYDALAPIRQWSHIMPFGFIEKVKHDPHLITVFGAFYGVTLAIQPFFPAIGGLVSLHIVECMSCANIVSFSRRVRMLQFWRYKST